MRINRRLPLILLPILILFSCTPHRKVYIAPKKVPIGQVPKPPVIAPPPPPVAWTAENAMRPVLIPPVLRDDEPAQSLLDAIDLSLIKYLAMDPRLTLRFGAEAVPLARVVASLGDFRARLAELGLSDGFFRYLRDHYVFYASMAPQVTFTGYYEPLLRGSRQPSPRYPYPLYGRPRDLVSVDLPQFYFYREQADLPQIRGRVDGSRLVPYYTREEIDCKSALAGRGLEILWVDSLVDVFFLHIQGSGIVEFEDKSRVYVGYADQNGHPFRSIGRHLLEQNLIDRGQLSLQGMKAFLAAQPDKTPAALNSNPSYIFFQVNPQSATGTFGTRLTPWRSIASDPRLFPQGALAWIECEEPIFDEFQRIIGWTRFGRFVLNQDTGGAIRGADHVDLFTGSGELSELVAGSMKQKGALFFLLKKEPAATPLQTDILEK